MAASCIADARAGTHTIHTIHRIRIIQRLARRTTQVRPRLKEAHRDRVRGVHRARWVHRDHKLHRMPARSLHSWKKVHVPFTVLMTVFTVVNVWDVWDRA